MTTQTMSPENKTVRPARKNRQQPVEPTVQQIIDKARSAPASQLGVWTVSSLSALLMWASFTPLDWGPLGWICLTPLILLIRLQQKPRWMYSVIFTCGFANALFTLQWMRLGHPTMWLALVALAFYMALYLPVFVGLSRTAVHHLGVPLTLAVPVVWVGLEFVRAHLMTGFAWYYLAHTQYRWIELIQISDLVGAYGVSFLVAMTAACLAGLMPISAFRKLRLAPAGIKESAVVTAATGHRRVLSVVACLTMFSMALGYGYYRRSQAQFVDGPRVALIQANISPEVKHTRNLEQLQRDLARIYRTHDALTGRAVQHQPVLIIWPETMFPWPLFEAEANLTDEQLEKLAPRINSDIWRSPVVGKRLHEISQMAGAALVIGVNRHAVDERAYRRYNSAVFVQPNFGITGRYDKMHRVPFGEYVPLKDELPFMSGFTPYGAEFGIAAGERASVFEYGNWRFSPLICFEDTVPHLVRSVVKSTVDRDNGGKPVDFLVNVTNDGWFRGSSELDQHLITASFRCIECRTPMVRAVNTGISAIIDGDGVVVEPEIFIDGDGKARTSMRDSKTGRLHKELNAAIVHNVPLDNRRSFYVTWGDWFAGFCSSCCGFVLICGLIPLRKRKQDGSDVASNG